MGETKIIAIKTIGEFHWGYSIRAVSESAAAHPYPVPPPSTLIGGLSYGLAKLSRLGESMEIKKEGATVLASRTLSIYDAVTWVAFGFDHLNQGETIILAQGYSDLTRLFRLVYQRGDRHRWEQKDMWFGVAAHGKVYYPSGAFKIVYLIDEEQIKKSGMIRDSIDDALVKACLSINRLGSKESLVSIRSAEITKDIRAVKPPASTSLYFPLALVESYEEEVGEVIELPVFDKDRLKRGLILRGPGLWIGDHESYVLPTLEIGYKGPGSIMIYKLSNQGALIKAVFGSGSEVLVVPRDIARVAIS
ncbi:type I-A CRISPR-associated protein Cas5 [Thermococci archaeon]|nr:MAG: type I-A CRISPR-associated protein Cas5 [Thermococci archaeon]